MRGIRSLTVLVCGSLLLPGCRKELCYDHDMHGFGVRVQLCAEWEQEWERDYGMGWEDSGMLPMTEGKKQILLYNDDTRYIVFDNIQVSSMASASTRTRSRSSYSKDHPQDRTVNAPDMLYGAWIESYTATLTTEPVPLNVTLRPLVYTYLIRYEFDRGLEHVTLARGALSGMAESVYLQDGHTGEQAATILFDCELKDYGAEVILASFGVPDFPGDHYGKQSGRQQRLCHRFLLHCLHQGFS